MTRIRSVLAATDFSADGHAAVMRAAQITAAAGARLTLVSVASAGALAALRDLAGLGRVEVADRVRDQMRTQLGQLAAEAAAGTVRPETVAAEGDVVGEVLRAAGQVEADLVVVGARGERRLRSVVLGSTAERLLRRARHPVLVVKQPPAGPYRRALLPVDFSAASTSALDIAVAVAPAADLIVVHAYEVPFESMLRHAGIDEDTILAYRARAREAAASAAARLLARAPATASHARQLIVHGDAAERIIEHEAVLEADLIIAGKHGRSAVESLLLGSVTERLLAAAHGDMLVLAPP